MKTNNSFSTIIKQFLELNANTLNSFDRINEAVVSDKQTIPLDILDADGNTKTVYIPSFGYMNRELTRLDANFKALAGLSKGTAQVKLADGSYQNILKSSLKTPASDITNVNRPVEFNVKPNYFFEDFLTPLLTIGFDVSGQVPTETERVLVKRIIFDSTFDFAVQHFDDNYKGVDNISYNDLIEDITTNNIPFFLDEDLRDMPYRSTEYYGKFDVTSISTVQKDVVVSGQDTTQTIKLYTLDTLSYTNADNDLANTEFLKIGDELMINSSLKTTKYKIKNIYPETRQVELDKIEGYESIKIGVDILSIYKSNDVSVSIDINVGFNERFVVFFKPVDAYSKILAENWSPGASVYSNELTFIEDNGNSVTLADYYKQNVADFGQFIRSLKEDAIPPSVLGVEPDAPTLLEENFSVIQINRHLTENSTALKVKKLNSDKIASEEAIKKLDEVISSTRSTLASKKYKSNIERSRDKNELASLSNERAAAVRLYSSIVNEISAISTDARSVSVAPKYRIRGFWSIPVAKYVSETIPQEVIKFIIEYRYLSTTGAASEVSQITFNDNGSERTGIFSNWNQVETPVRSRLRDKATGKFYWADTAVEDGQVVNFNQLDIPIQSGEMVEIRVRSVSEAGWPSNPRLSGWSDTIRVSFPTGGLDTVDITSIINSNVNQLAKVELLEELDSRGVYSHIDDSFTINEKYYTHNSTSIASGFLSPEQNPISLFDKLTDLQNQISVLQEKINDVRGELSVKLVNEDGTFTTINRNTNNKIFAGYYVDEVAEMSVKKGHIVTKTFKLMLENTNATTLELIARMAGDRTLPVYKSTTSSNGFGIDPNGAIQLNVVDDRYYTTEGKYDLVPVQYQTISADEQEYYNQNSPYQSSQKRGQFLYSRFMDISNTEALYVLNPIDPNDIAGNFSDFENELSYSDFNGSASVIFPTGDAETNAYIWTGTFGRNKYSENQQIDPDPENPNVFVLDEGFSNSIIDVTNAITAEQYDNSLFMHKDHPDLRSIFNSYLNNMTGTDITIDAMSDQVQNLVNSMIYSLPVTANLQANEPFGKSQIAYRYENSDLSETYARSVKMSFDANDQYLLGGKSCGSFLFLSPTNREYLSVNGDNKFGTKNIVTGENNAISVDVVFQYRMTDYSGNTSATDTGRVGGIMSRNVSNLTYAKRIGIDIFDNSDDQFSFDIEVFAKYKPEGSNQNSVRAAQLSA